ncbi:DNA-binding protein [Acidobacteria bacterium Mor1]|nr:DNA-binding protein [Acidobacteria bacterium Mor1]
MAETARLGSRVRALRRARNLRQTKLAEMLGISPSYLNLIEHDRRPLSANLLLKLAELFQLDLQQFAAEDDARVASDLMEVFGDPAFDRHGLNSTEVREFALSSPTLARAVIQLYQVFRSTRESALSLASQLSEDRDLPGVDYSSLPSEEVTDFIHAHENYFPLLEDAATDLWKQADLRPDDMYHGLSGYLREVHGIRIEYVDSSADGGAVRRFDPQRKLLILSEALPRSSRKFQIAHQIGLVQHSPLLDELTRSEATLTADSSRGLARIALANYFAGAVVMPYERFIDEVRRTRYDIDLLENRFGASFEQVCHRLTTLRKQGNEGIPFHLVRADVAGNISKRFSSSGIKLSRFGACPRWNLHTTFLTPGTITKQLSEMPDGAVYFCVARTVAKGARGYQAPKAIQAITLGCEVRHAKRMVYADAVDVDQKDALVPIGTTCRLCDRDDCEQRAFPRLQVPLQVDENLRGVSFYAPPAGEGS